MLPHGGPPRQWSIDDLNDEVSMWKKSKEGISAGFVIGTNALLSGGSSDDQREGHFLAGDNDESQALLSPQRDHSLLSTSSSSSSSDSDDNRDPTLAQALFTPIALGHDELGVESPRGGQQQLQQKKKQSESAEEPIEMTWYGVVLVVVLSALMGGANAYLALFSGITISVSIPCALIALVILRPFDRSITALQINVIQTGASAGSSLVAGVVYTLPALMFLGYWEEGKLDYLETAIISATGGCLGVLFSIPLRRSLVVESPDLVFPEGTAIANVLKVIAGQNANSRAHSKAVHILFLGCLIGFVIKFCDTGFQFWSSFAFGAWFLGSSGAVIGFGVSLSPALLSVGYIVGLKAGGLMVVGALLNWWLAIPIVSSTQPDWIHRYTALQIANDIWLTKSRYLGVGAMLVGGIGTVAFLARPLYRGIKSGIHAWKQIRTAGSGSIPRTERDIPLVFVACAAAASPLVLLFLFFWFSSSWGIAAFAGVFLLLAGFLFSAVGGFMAGLVGSSNNPISGITLCVVIVSALLLVPFVSVASFEGPVVAILMGAVIACAAALAGDNLQDLRTGYILGATPWKQQLMQMVGVVSASAVLAPIIGLLITAYGIGSPSLEHPNPLPAPQATLMGQVAQGVFTLDLPWTFVGTGAGFATFILIVDFLLVHYNINFRVPVLAIALGLYLPFELSSAIFLGSCISGLCFFTLKRIEPSKIMRQQYLQYGVYLCAGMITGEALTGILLAVVIIASGDTNVLAVLGPQSTFAAGLLLFICIMIVLYLVVIWTPFKKPLHDYFGLYLPPDHSG